MFLGSASQLTFKKLLLVEFYCGFKQNVYNNLRRLLKCTLLFQCMSICGLIFFMYFNPSSAAVD